MINFSSYKFKHVSFFICQFLWFFRRSDWLKVTNVILKVSITSGIMLLKNFHNFWFFFGLLFMCHDFVSFGFFGKQVLRSLRFAPVFSASVSSVFRWWVLITFIQSEIPPPRQSWWGFDWTLWTELKFSIRSSNPYFSDDHLILCPVRLTGNLL